jgi:hypothetical protein
VQQVANDAISALYGDEVSIVDQLFPDVNAAWGGLGDVFSWVSGVFSKLWSIISNVVHWILHNLIPDIIDVLHTLRDKLKAWLAPIVNYIKFQKAWLDALYQNVIKPVLTFLQRLRGVLVLFRLFHMKWAEELDQYIAGIESRITQAFLRMRGDINMLANWINYIIDPTGIFQPYPFMLSAISSVNQLWALIMDAPSWQLGAVDQQNAQTSSVSGYYGNVITEIQGRAGGATAYDLSRQTQITEAFQADGYKIGGG